MNDLSVTKHFVFIANHWSYLFIDTLTFYLPCLHTVSSMKQHVFMAILGN